MVSATGTYIDPVQGGQGLIRYAIGTFVKFSVPGSSCCIQPVGINLEGTVAGTFTDANGVYHGFLRYATGHIITFAPKGSTGTESVGINSLGDVTGTYSDATSISHGFIRHADGSVVTFDPAGSGLTQPAAINLAGAVTGYYGDGKVKVFSKPRLRVIDNREASDNKVFNAMGLEGGQKVFVVLVHPAQSPNL